MYPVTPWYHRPWWDQTYPPYGITWTSGTVMTGGNAGSVQSVKSFYAKSTDAKGGEA